MKKQVAKKQNQEVAEQEMTVEGWGETPEIGANDIIIPKILAMQGLSEFVAEGKAQIGDFRESINGAKIGSIDQPFEFIPVHIDKVWITSKKVEGRFKFQSIEQVTRNNENLPWSFEINGEEYRRDYTMNCYCMLPVEVESGLGMPYIISFRRTSFKAGQKLFTQMYVRNKQMGKVPPATVMSLCGKREKNDQGTFIVMDVAESRYASNDEVKAAFNLFKTIQCGNMKVDNSDYYTEASRAPSEGSVSNQF